MPRTVHVLLSGLMALLLTGCFLHGFEPPRTVPPEYEQRLQLGAAFEKQGEWERAVQEYAKAAQHSDKGHLALGKLYAQRGNLPEAETALRLAMRTIKDNPELYNDLANVLLERGKDLEEAEDLAQLSVKIGNQDTFAESWNTLNNIRTIRYRKETKQTEMADATETAQVEPKPVKLTAAPEKASVPAASPAKASVKVPANAPDKTLVKAPVKASGEAPKKKPPVPAQTKTGKSEKPSAKTGKSEKAVPKQATPPKQPATKKTVQPESAKSTRKTTPSTSPTAKTQNSAAISSAPSPANVKN